MITKEKGYSLGVLVITIAIMIILASTAIVTMRNLTGDREVTNFMTDLREVEDYVKDYYTRKNILPVKYDDNKNPQVVNLTDEMREQIDENDRGNYYLIDLNKLEKINLSDSNRGYFLNESSLNVYVSTPLTYDGEKYYTLTDELLGINKTYGNTDNFEVVIIGNPITWVSSANLLVSIPNRTDVNDAWSFKYQKGPITAEEFRTKGTFFKYNEPIEVTENGIYSFYIEDANGYAKVVNVVVTKIDDIDPYVYITNEEKIVAGDDETGIKKVMYKIQDYDIKPNYRAEKIDVYFQGERKNLSATSDGKPWTYEEAYTGEKIVGITPSVGKSINSYKSDYEAYLEEYARIEEESGDVVSLDDTYPQFQHNGRPYGDNEANIILYVEDYAGNRSVTDKNNYLCKVSRNMLLNSNFVDAVMKPLSGAKIVVNDGVMYTSESNVNLSLRAQGAEYMYLTYNKSYVPSESDYIPFDTAISNYTLPDEEGEITLYVYLTSKQYDENDELIYEKAEAKIIRDTQAPDTTAPQASIGNDLKLTVINQQKDTTSGIAKIEYGYKVKDASVFTWVTSLDGVVLEEGKTYEVKTRATDNVGKTSESNITEVQAPVQIAITVPNEPAMAPGMTAIVWDGSLARPEDEMVISSDTWKNKSGEKAIWYSYQVGNNRTDTRDNIWANAKTSDGSYWVWIPRYAYKITYFTDASKTTVTGYYKNSTLAGQGYFKEDGTTKVSTNEEINAIKTMYLSIDVIFLNGTSNNQYREENPTTKAITLKQLPSDYIVHPAFQAYSLDSTNDFNSYGKWSSEVSGIWVAKFEASRSDADFDDEGSPITYNDEGDPILPKIKSVPSVKSWTDISIKDAYVLSSHMYPTYFSHLMKNSEWGAVAYLAYSAYGRNGNDISCNRELDHITGAGGQTDGYENISRSIFNSRYAYNVRDTANKSIGMYASTTGNIYGIYDMVGGVSEYVATYLSNTKEPTTSNGNALKTVENPEYREILTYLSSSDEENSNYSRHGREEGLYGGALYETSLQGKDQTAVGSAYSVYPAKTNPFLTRGGEAGSAAPGIFSFESANGEASSNIGFRPVLAFR